MVIGTAGWSIPAQYKNTFPATGSQLERYAYRLDGVEINSSFYRSHQRKTYERWAASVPQHFRFAVKMPRTITQDRRLQDYGDLLTRFGEEISGLGAKLGVILVQLPPSLAFDSTVATAFMRDLHKHTSAAIACEPRHASWFTPAANSALARLKVARVAADPPRAQADGNPGGWRNFAYWRLHGSPKTYYSDYGDAAIKQLAPKLGAQDWCIFDNTAAFAALGNALTLAHLTDA